MGSGERFASLMVENCFLRTSKKETSEITGPGYHGRTKRWMIIHVILFIHKFPFFSANLIVTVSCY